ncbi:LOW QUALITY PROTEIN: hypothetical protein CVT25_006334 [Psilocybe cyanescens]|uniref:CxC2-like cysteine cluster KDZ transposase-associated domain-containing protein n=1 Tax=Psilocybe cyanescens TaxID=93625 RepID=A0A409X3T1_PSICY|nr:LOW QUALITY PROTEIN: hypothetical protein CVT25_006334 [Psilocybe cyanescens]
MDNIDKNNPDASETSRKKRACTAADDPLKEWVEHDRECDLQEILRLDGQGDYARYPHCYKCNSQEAVYQCVDCDQIDMFCGGCVVKNHAVNPLHCIQVYLIAPGAYIIQTDVLFNKNGTPSTLSTQTLGLCVQLGHVTSQKCVNPWASPGDSFVINSNGIHEISLDFCDLSTIQVSKQFHLTAFESKLSSYEFYNSLAWSSDNTGLYNDKHTDLVWITQDCYNEFMCMYQKWTNLVMEKHTGRGHDLLHSLELTEPGECALLCPTCPPPGKNLLLGWEDEPPEKGSVNYFMFPNYSDILLVGFMGSFLPSTQIFDSPGDMFQQMSMIQVLVMAGHSL